MNRVWAADRFRAAGGFGAVDGFGAADGFRADHRAWPQVVLSDDTSIGDSRRGDIYPTVYVGSGRTGSTRRASSACRASSRCRASSACRAGRIGWALVCRAGRAGRALVCRAGGAGIVGGPGEARRQGGDRGGGGEDGVGRAGRPSNICQKWFDKVNILIDRRGAKCMRKCVTHNSPQNGSYNG